jgi:plasmid maintenance system killer protein
LPRFQLTQEDAKEAYRRFRTNPGHPGLHFKKLEGEQNIYSVRIGLNYRALAVVEGSRAVWYWIGDHETYDRLT